MRAFFLAIAAASALVLPAKAADVTVAVTAIVEHPALDAARDGIKQALADAGYKDGENLKFVYESAQGNPGTAAQIARKFVGDEPTVIVPISTPSAQAVAAATHDIPIVFTAVTDPVGAQLVKNLEKPGANITGLSDMSPVPDHIKLIKEITPNARKIGFVYNTAEANSISTLAAMKAEAEKNGMTIVESVATKSSEVQGATRALIGRVDVIYIPTDNTIVSALEAAVGVAEEAKVPLYSGDTDSVARGALASVSFNYFDVGKQTGEIVVRILKGEAAGDIPVRVATGSDLFVNKKAAAKMGVTLSDDLIKRAKKVIE